MANIKIFQLLPDVYDMLLGVTNSIVMQDRVAIKLNDQGISACMIQGHSALHYIYYDDGSDIKLPLDRLENPVCL